MVCLFVCLSPAIFFFDRRRRCFLRSSLLRIFFIRRRETSVEEDNSHEMEEMEVEKETEHVYDSGGGSDCMCSS